MFQIDISLLICLLAAHFIGDFIFQTKEYAGQKRKPSVFIKHITIITALTYVITGAWTAWFIPLLAGITHAAIDYLKLISRPDEKQELTVFLVDQAAHAVALVLKAVLLPLWSEYSLYWVSAFGPAYINLLIILTGAILVVKVGGIIIGMLTKPYLYQITNGSPGSNDRGLTNGGRIIGELERLLILFFVMSGLIQAIGFLIAAKSIFRFGELNDKENRKEAEYIIIGTLWSFSWAFLFSWLITTLIH